MAITTTPPMARRAKAAAHRFAGSAATKASIGFALFVAAVLCGRQLAVRQVCAHKDGKRVRKCN